MIATLAGLAIALGLGWMAGRGFEHALVKRRLERNLDDSLARLTRALEAEQGLWDPCFRCGLPRKVHLMPGDVQRDHEFDEGGR